MLKQKNLTLRHLLTNSPCDYFDRKIVLFHQPYLTYHVKDIILCQYKTVDKKIRRGS